jgi:hypothetical protein
VAMHTTGPPQLEEEKRMRVEGFVKDLPKR